MVSGRIEGDEAVIASRSVGRVVEVTVREGDTVQTGAILARISDDAVNARVAAAQSTLSQAGARLQAAQRQIPVLQEQSNQTGLRVDQAAADFSGRASEAQAKMTASDAGVRRAQAQLRSAHQEVEVVREKICQAEIEKQQALSDAAGRVTEAEGRVASAEATLAQALVTAEQAEREARRYQNLAKQEAVTVQEAEQRTATSRSAADAVEAARKNVASARGARQTASALLKNPNVKNAQINTLRSQLRSAEEQEKAAKATIEEMLAIREQASASARAVGAGRFNARIQETEKSRIAALITQAESEVKSSEAAVGQAGAQLNESLSAQKELVIKAPFAGTVITRSVEPGATVAAGTPLVTLLDLNKVYLRGYVPIGKAGGIAVGKAARIYLDSAPTTPVEAVVERVDPQAQFTPENTYFRDDRVRQVIGLKLLLRSPNAGAKPGIPAEGAILTSGSTWPVVQNP